MGSRQPSGHFRQPSADDVAEALSQLLGSSSLRLSERNRRFLSFVVEQTVAGHADRIKAYLIGVDVFGRDETFDPNIDPIVRIEATRLRSALTTFYETDGENLRVRILIPPGSYVPVFSWSPEAAASETAHPTHGEKGSGRERFLATVVIKDRTDQCDSDTALRGELFADALTIRLRQARIRIFAVPSEEHKAASASLTKLFSNPGNAISLEISVHTMGSQRRLAWRATDLSNSEIKCCGFRDLLAASTPCFDAIDSIADALAASICAEFDLGVPANPWHTQTFSSPSV